MRLIIDSNRFIDLCTDRHDARATLEAAAQVFVPFIAMAEIHVGAKLAPRLQWQVESLDELLVRPHVRLVHSTDATCRHYATLFAQLRRAGTPIPTNDIWIAALALEHDATLYSADAHFDLLPQVPRI